MKLPRPQPKPASPQKIAEWLMNPERVVVTPEINGEYLHWDDLRRRRVPPGLDHETWWTLVVHARMALLRPFPLQDKVGREFRYAMPDSVLRLVHTVDRDASGRIETPENIVNRGTRDHYVMASLMEEAITSSQLEGAATTRRVAKEMLESGRAPRNRGEQMIWNNFRAMEWVRSALDHPITPDAILDLHRMVTLDALDGGNDRAGTYRTDADQVSVIDHDDGEILHVPPAASTLPERMEALCRFANGTDEDGFIHPLARAILLHFWLAYDHPFVDGNGRAARALFYWSMLKQGYWLAEFLSISRVIKKAPAQYARAYLHAEDGSNDATYFLIHQLRVLRTAIDDLFEYLKAKTRELRDVESRLRRRDDLNPRQLTILARALRSPEERWTIQQHQRTSGVTYQTARTDLIGLVEKGFLTQHKVGRAFVYDVALGLERRLAKR